MRNIRKKIKRLLEDFQKDVPVCAVIEITIPMSYMPLKYYYQVVPFHLTQQKRIHVRNSVDTGRSISTKNIKILKVFADCENPEIDTYLKELRTKNTINEQDGVNKYKDGNMVPILQRFLNLQVEIVKSELDDEHFYDRMLRYNPLYVDSVEIMDEIKVIHIERVDGEMLVDVSVLINSDVDLSDREDEFDYLFDDLLFHIQNETKIFFGDVVIRIVDIVENF